MSEGEDNIRPSGPSSEPGAEAQESVNAYFDSEAPYWDEIYRGDDLQDLIYQRRQDFVLSEVDACRLGEDARVLEIGSGAGHLTEQLARRAGHIAAIDASQAMVDVTSARLRAEGKGERVQVSRADAHTLPFPPASFDLVVAVGVIPWLHSPSQAVNEMARVLRPGGTLVLTADNRARLTSFTDPRRVLALPPLKRVYRRLRGMDPSTISRLHAPRSVDRMLRDAGLRPITRRTVGFGPLSFMGRAVLVGARGVALDRRLQSMADRGAVGLRWAGWHYVVRAEKR
jgi:ubiquinone/menaquinone biosynthesis C-methylase UbiE